MADLNFRGLYGYDYNGNNFEISLQFHITALCDQSCKHCYMFNSESYERQIKDQLKKEDMIKLIKEFVEFSKKNGIRPNIALTGGDPILSPYFWDILEYANSLNLQVSIMGNSYHINDKVAKRLRSLNVCRYQISLDGLEETHDNIRKQGSFNDALRALEVLYRNDINTSVMFTISKFNYKDLIPLYLYLNEIEFVDAFGFDRMIPTGNASKCSEEIMNNDDYVRIMFELFKFQVIKKPRLMITMKDTLWKLFMNDLGLTNPIDTSLQTILNGCTAGINMVSVIADGTFYACRRLEIPIGKYPEKSFEEIYRFNSEVKNILDVNSYESCNKCNLRAYCRGCLAMKYAISHQIYAKDPNCWRCNNV